MAPTEPSGASPDKPFAFTDLYPEIRNEVYQIIARQVGENKMPLAIAGANKQMRREALKIICDQTEVRFHAEREGAWINTVATDMLFAVKQFCFSQLPERADWNGVEGMENMGIIVTLGNKEPIPGFSLLEQSDWTDIEGMENMGIIVDFGHVQPIAAVQSSGDVQRKVKILRRALAACGEGPREKRRFLICANLVAYESP
ncbi:hypothetical protein B0A50_02309 [Salinomyces thailandicus]|uniref:Uncharacterized protein n=1 Tax=Salinomyces thailandicus TaxID=706561 RepID=A0A4U0U9V6_9PEZI|nr:hypothetical protein B0A50_02309 [Salinomyces thailandica]